MKNLKSLFALLLVLAMVFCLMACSKNVEEENEKDEVPSVADEEKEEQTEPEATTEKSEEEAAFVGVWELKLGYNASEGLIKGEEELAMELCLNEDLTGTFGKEGQTVAFTWNYVETKAAPYNPSVYYMHFQCIPEPGAVIPGEEELEEFYFEVDTEDKESIFLTVGNWLYTCARA